MEHAAVGTTDIILNVAWQVVNLIIFFVVFKYALGDKISSLLDQRTALIKKIENAEKEYKSIIESVQKEGDKIVQDALSHKQELIQEATLLAAQKKQDILDQAQIQANNILKDVEIRSNNLQQELKDNREHAVKETSKSVVKKLITSDKNLRTEYLNELVQEASKNM